MNAHEKMPMIEVRDLSKNFKDISAVDSISFSVKRGEIFAFIGPNGAGKSTTIKMLTTLLNPTGGKITIDGVDISKKTKIREKFGIVFQDPSLDTELTAYENMEFHSILYNVPKSIRVRRIEELLRYVSLWDRKDDLVKTFSGGMKRRLEIARGLTHHPKILFLDEPTLGLDSQTRNFLWEHLKKVNKEEGTTVFFTTHYLDEAEHIADQIAIIDKGKIVMEGTVRQILKKTNSKSLEKAYLKLTGSTIREEGSGKDMMRMMNRVMRR